MQYFKEKLAEQHNYVDIDGETEPVLWYLHDKYLKLVGRGCILRDRENNKIITNTRGVRTNQPKPAIIYGVTHSLVIFKYKTYNVEDITTELTITASFAAIHCGAISLELLTS